MPMLRLRCQPRVLEDVRRADEDKMQLRYYVSNIGTLAIPATSETAQRIMK